ncbi:MAG TPA: hypothetical protein DIT33_17090 [Pseudomonas sp.]|nr:hypothetical protein [Pseudomonas sp.]
MQRTKLHCRSLLIVVFIGRCQYRLGLQVRKCRVLIAEGCLLLPAKPCGASYIRAHPVITRAP